MSILMTIAECVVAVAGTSMVAYPSFMAVRSAKARKKFLHYLKEEENSVPRFVLDLLQTNAEDWEWNENKDFVLKKEPIPGLRFFSKYDTIRIEFSKLTNMFGDPLYTYIRKNEIKIDGDQLHYPKHYEEIGESIEGLFAYLNVLKIHKSQEKDSEKKEKTEKEKEQLEKELDHLLYAEDATLSFEQNPTYGMNVLQTENYYLVKVYERKKEYSYYMLQLDLEDLTTQQRFLGTGATVSLYEKKQKLLDKRIKEILKKRKEEKENLNGLFQASLTQTHSEG